MVTLLSTMMMAPTRYNNNLTIKWVRMRRKLTEIRKSSKVFLSLRMHIHNNNLQIWLIINSCRGRQLECRHRCLGRIQTYLCRRRGRQLECRLRCLGKIPICICRRTLAMECQWCSLLMLLFLFLIDWMKHQDLSRFPTSSLRELKSKL